MEITSAMEQRIRRLRVIGRVHNVNFEDLKAVDNIVYPKYRKACLGHDLEFDDKLWFDALEESELSKC